MDKENRKEKPAGKETGATKRKNKGKNKKKKDQKGYVVSSVPNTSAAPGTGIEVDPHDTDEPKSSILNQMFNKVANKFGKSLKKSKHNGGGSEAGALSLEEKSGNGVGTSTGSDAGPSEHKTLPRRGGSPLGHITIPKKGGVSEPVEVPRPQKKGRGRGRMDQKVDSTVMAEVHAMPSPPPAPGPQPSGNDDTLASLKSLHVTDWNRETVEAQDEAIAESTGIITEFQTETMRTPETNAWLNQEVDKIIKGLVQTTADADGTTKEIETESVKTVKTNTIEIETESVKTVKTNMIEIETESVKTVETNMMVDLETTEISKTTEALVDTDGATKECELKTGISMLDQKIAKMDENVKLLDEEMKVIRKTVEVCGQAIVEADKFTKEFKTNTLKPLETVKLLDQTTAGTDKTTIEIEGLTVAQFIEITQTYKPTEILAQESTTNDGTTDEFGVEPVQSRNTNVKLDQDIVETEGTGKELNSKKGEPLETDTVKPLETLALLDQESVGSDEICDEIDMESIKTLKASAKFDQENAETDGNANVCDTESTMVDLETAESEGIDKDFDTGMVEIEATTKFGKEAAINESEKEAAGGTTDEIGKETAETDATSAKELDGESTKTEGSTKELDEEMSKSAASSRGPDGDKVRPQSANRHQKKEKIQQHHHTEVYEIDQCSDLLQKLGSKYAALTSDAARETVRMRTAAQLAQMGDEDRAANCQGDKANRQGDTAKQPREGGPPADYTLEQGRPVIHHHMQHSKEEILRMVFYVQKAMRNQNCRQQLYFTAERVLYALSNWHILDAKAQDYEIRRLVFVYVSYRVSEEFAHRVIEYIDYTRDVDYVPVLDKVRRYGPAASYGGYGSSRNADHRYNNRNRGGGARRGSGNRQN